jgi:hypothetical protein
VREREGEIDRDGGGKEHRIEKATEICYKQQHD